MDWFHLPVMCRPHVMEFQCYKCQIFKHRRYCICTSIINYTSVTDFTPTPAIRCTQTNSLTTVRTCGLLKEVCYAQSCDLIAFKACTTVINQLSILISELPPGSPSPLKRLERQKYTVPFYCVVISTVYNTCAPYTETLILLLHYHTVRGITYKACVHSTCALSRFFFRRDMRDQTLRPWRCKDTVTRHKRAKTSVPDHGNMGRGKCVQCYVKTKEVAVYWWNFPCLAITRLIVAAHIDAKSHPCRAKIH